MHLLHRPRLQSLNPHGSETLARIARALAFAATFLACTTERVEVAEIDWDGGEDGFGGEGDPPTPSTPPFPVVRLDAGTGDAQGCAPRAPSSPAGYSCPLSCPKGYRIENDSALCSCCE